MPALKEGLRAYFVGKTRTDGYRKKLQKRGARNLQILVKLKKKSIIGLRDKIAESLSGDSHDK